MSGYVYPLTSLTQLKAVLGKDDTTNDPELERVIARATDLADQFTRRNLRARTYGGNGLDEEYYDGKGTGYLRTRQWPIISVTSLYDDTTRDWGSDQLKASTDYDIYYKKGMIHLRPDAAKGSSFQVGHKNIQLVYTAGYGTYEIHDGVNDAIDFEESTGVELNAAVAEDEYSVADLLTAIKTALDAAGASTYTITFDYWTGKFTLTSDLGGGGGTFKILWSTGTNAATSIGRTIGVDVSADDTTAASQTADESALGIPGDLEDAVLMICLRMIKRSKGFGGLNFDIETRSEVRTGVMGGTTKYDTNEIPGPAMEILKRYRRRLV